jgi:Tfp pilus assembly protein PilO
VSAARSRAPLWRQSMWPFVVLLAANLVGLLGYTWPRLERERDLEARLSSVRRTLAAERASVEALRERSGIILQNRADERRFVEEVVPARDGGLFEVLEDVEAMAADAGLELTSRRYRPRKVQGMPLLRLSISLPVSGSYRQLVALIGRLEQSKHLLVVDGVQLQEAGGGSGGNLSVDVSTYLREEADDAGTGG